MANQYLPLKDLTPFRVKTKCYHKRGKEWKKKLKMH